MNELIVKYKVATCHFIYVIALSFINYNIKFTVHNKLESYIHRYESGGRTIGMRTIGMRTIGMEDNWHAENWHGGQLALTF